MSIKYVKATNFKTFKELDIKLQNFNILIGANASGKSNLILIFKFLRDIVNHGLDNAISMQGGMEYLKNIYASPSDNVTIEIGFSEDGPGILVDNKSEKPIGVKRIETIYKLVLNKKGSGYKIIEDKLINKCEFYELNIKNKEHESQNIEEKSKYGNGELNGTDRY